MTKSKRIHIAMDEKTLELLDDAARRVGVSRAAMIRILVHQGLGNKAKMETNPEPIID